MAEVKKGTRIGSYTIIEGLAGGKGGMATVFRAQDSQQKIEAALKISRNDYEHPKFGNALKLEVDILKPLRHPGVVRLIPLRLASAKQEVYIARALEISGHPWFYAMEFLHGKSLKVLLKRIDKLPFPVSCSIATRMVDTLKYLHSQGVIHLDIKPENILFRYNPEIDASIEPVLIDFGVAARSKSLHTVGGSLHTMAPEHIRHTRGEIPQEAPVDPEKMDIYSLGVVAYRKWTGTYPFGGISANKITSAILNNAVTPPKSLNHELHEQAEMLMMRWLAKDPDHRPTLDELKMYLYYWSEGLSAFPELPKSRSLKWSFWKK